jgi:hypothetical protein
MRCVQIEQIICIQNSEENLLKTKFSNDYKNKNDDSKIYDSKTYEKFINEHYFSIKKFKKSDENELDSFLIIFNKETKEIMYTNMPNLSSDIFVNEMSDLYSNNIKLVDTVITFVAEKNDNVFETLSKNKFKKAYSDIPCLSIKDSNELEFQVFYEHQKFQNKDYQFRAFLNSSLNPPLHLIKMTKYIERFLHIFNS